ncbi:MAG: divalent-cation tolerance protein CutA [Parvularcula sp.]
MPEDFVSDLVIVQTTLPDLSTAQRVARALVDTKLAACVQLSPVMSVFFWEGDLEEAKEFRLDIKTSPARLSALLSEVERVHPYDVPEILVHDQVASSRRYAQWVAVETASQT